MKYRDIPDWTVVRVDGRLASYCRKGPRNKPMVMFAGSLGRQVALAEDAEVVKYPAQLAGDFVEAE